MENIENSPLEQSENITPPQVGLPAQAGTSFLGKLKPKWPIVLGVLSGIVIFAALIYAVFSYGRRGQEIQPTPTLAVTPLITSVLTLTPTATLIPILPTSTPSELIEVPEDWKTYTNEKYRYKIQYPPEARTDEERDEYFAVYLGEKGTLVGSYSSLNVQVAENPKGLSRRYFLADWLREDPENVLANVKIDDAVIGGVDALRVVLDGSWWQGTGAHTVYVVPRGSEMYLIWNDQYWGGRKEAGTAFELNKGTFFKEIEKMLSTFKFLD